MPPDPASPPPELTTAQLVQDYSSATKSPNSSISSLDFLNQTAILPILNRIHVLFPNPLLNLFTPHLPSSSPSFVQNSLPPRSPSHHPLHPSQSPQPLPVLKPDHTLHSIPPHSALLNYLALPSLPNIPRRTLPPSTTSPLLAVVSPLPTPNRSSFGPLFLNSHWVGKQFSEEKSYAVNVQVIHLDLDLGSGSGVLDIKGLTEEWPTMTTFFDIEVVGPRHEFLTRAWHSSVGCDYEHWSLFPPFETYLSARQATLATGSRELNPNDPEDRRLLLSNSSWEDRRAREEWWLEQRFLFMRWKERFLVNDYKKQEIDGASFAGFYYVCLELPRPTVSQASSRVRTAGDGVDRLSTSPPASCISMPSSRSESYANVVRRSSSTGATLTTSFSPSERPLLSPAFSLQDRPPERPGSAPPNPPRGRPPSRQLVEEDKPQPTRPQAPLDMRAPKAFLHQLHGPIQSATDTYEEDSEQHERRDHKWGWEGAKIQGFYYHPKSEPFQELLLHFDPEVSNPSINSSRSTSASSDMTKAAIINKTTFNAIHTAKKAIARNANINDIHNQTSKMGFGSPTYQIC